MNYIIYIIIGILSIANSITDRSNQKNPYSDSQCAQSEVLEALLRNNVNVEQAQIAYEKGYVDYLTSRDKLENWSGGPYLLPIVFHVIHNGGVENIPDAQVLGALDMLNASYANIGYYDQGTGVSMDLQFCLAKQDPLGNPTNGINRVKSILTDFDYTIDDINLKNLSRWNPLDYINVWIVQEIRSVGGTGVAGYAYLPSSHGLNWDGIVVEAQFTGTVASQNAILTHEIGHYLGLYHTFQGGCINNNCMTDGDRICDTPPDATTVRPPCNNPINSCHTDATSGLSMDEDDMITNYMDYSNLECYSAFTEGQKDRTHFTIEKTRYSLLESKGCNDPCPVQIIADASVSPSGMQFIVGSQISFTNTSINASSYEWNVNGKVESTSKDFVYTFNDQGFFEITLSIVGTQPQCKSEKKWIFNAKCGTESSFQVNSVELSIGDALLTNNTSTGALTYRWIMDGSQVSTNFNFNITFNTSGVHEIYLITNDGICKDTSDHVIVTVVKNGLARTGLPSWPLINKDKGTSHVVDWSDKPPVTSLVSGATMITSAGHTGAAFDGCGNLKFVVAHFGDNKPNSMFVYSPKGDPLIDDNVNAPGLNSVKGPQEIQVVPVPEKSSEWYIIYNKYQKDEGSPGNSAKYAAANILYSHVVMENDQLIVIKRDILLLVNGEKLTYTDGKAVSRTALGKSNQHFLFAVRRKIGQTSLSVDRYLITSNGIEFYSTTGTVPATWYSRAINRCPIELNPTEDYLAIVNRNADRNQDDIFIFDTEKFDNIAYQAISLGELKLKADNASRDLSSVLNIDVIVKDITRRPSVPLQFLINMEKKVHGIEWSLNGRFLYFAGGGYTTGGNTTELSYIGQIDIETDYPFDLRLRIQTTPGNIYNPRTGAGCDKSNNSKCTTEDNFISYLESCYDGNLYFSKRNKDSLFVIPQANNFMAQNLIPGVVDFSTPDEPNINIGIGVRSFPDQIDGFNYIDLRRIELDVEVRKWDCDSICQNPYIVELWRADSVKIERVTAQSCPDTLKFCVDTNYSYYLYNPENGITYFDAIKNGVVVYPKNERIFDFSEVEPCIEMCGNGIDDDGDGLVDCDDPDLKDECCCIDPDSLNLGPDIIVCKNGVFVFDAGGPFKSYKWQDGFDQKQYTAYEAGKYWVTVIDSCDNVLSDTVDIDMILRPILNLGDSAFICRYDSMVYLLDRFDKWKWVTEGTIDCDTCELIILKPDSTQRYIIIGEYGAGCFSVDTLNIIVDQGVILYDTLSLCIGDTLVFLDSNITKIGSFEFIFPSTAECDSIIFLEVIPAEGTFDNQAYNICPKDSILWRGEWLKEGKYEKVISVLDDCDSFITIRIEPFDTSAFVLSSVNSCPGEKNGSIELAFTGGPTSRQISWSTGTTGPLSISGLDTGLYSVEVLDENGCISRKSIRIKNYDLKIPDIMVKHPLCGDEEKGSILWSSNDYPYVFINGGSFSSSNGIQNLAPGTYAIEFKSEEGCVVDTTITIDTGQDFTPFIVDTIEVHYGDSITLDVDVNPPGTYEYLWEPCDNLSCCDCDSPIFSGTKTERLTVTITDINGCAKKLTILIVVKLEKRVWAPNIFSPNGDGINDRFNLFGNRDLIGIPSIEIYDRWGELIYRGLDLEPGNTSQGWDGTFNGEKMNPAVFTYKARVVFIDGESRIESGSLTLIR